jgi:hypothetical protein
MHGSGRCDTIAAIGWGGGGPCKEFRGTDRVLRREIGAGNALERIEKGKNRLHNDHCNVLTDEHDGWHQLYVAGEGQMSEIDEMMRGGRGSNGAVSDFSRKRHGWDPSCFEKGWTFALGSVAL